MHESSLNVLAWDQSQWKRNNISQLMPTLPCNAHVTTERRICLETLQNYLQRTHKNLREFEENCVKRKSEESRPPLFFIKRPVQNHNLKFSQDIIHLERKNQWDFPKITFYVENKVQQKVCNAANWSTHFHNFTIDRMCPWYDLEKILFTKY